MLPIVVWGVAAILSALVAGFLAVWKHRDWSKWMAWCFVFPPLIFMLMILPSNEGPPPRRPTLDEEDAMPDT